MPAHPLTSSPEIVAAGRRLLEEQGIEALTMKDVADAVGIRPSSLYKRVNGKTELFRMILDDLAEELANVIDQSKMSADPVANLRTLIAAYRRFAHEHPIAYTLWWAPNPPPGGPERSQRATRTLLGVINQIVGPDDALLSARTVVAWAHGFITLELAEGFQLRGNLEEAWAFGLDRVVAAIQVVDRQ